MTPADIRIHPANCRCRRCAAPAAADTRHRIGLAVLFATGLAIGFAAFLLTI